MAKKSKDNKNLIIGICAAVVVVVIVAVIAIVLATKNSLNDDYFVSDDTKYVLTLESDDVSSDDGKEYDPVKTHLVYTYDGDTITGLKTYGVYADADAAKKAFDAMKEAGEDMSNVTLEGKYIILVNAASEYEGMTASDVKKNIELLEMLKGMGSGDSTDDSEGDNDEGEGEEVEDEEE